MDINSKSKRLPTTEYSTQQEGRKSNSSQNQTPEYSGKVTDKLGPIRKGLLELVVLKIISHAQVYAADILAKLNSTEFATQEGTLYPLLSRLRREGAVEYEWKESDAGPPRKYYRLTAKGRQQLKELLAYWKDLDLTINQF